MRNIIEIDESKCDGCGKCVTACAEGAIQVVDGKARLVAEIYCDGLGACLGECPQGAITITPREAAAFDEEATRRHLAGAAAKKALPTVSAGCPGMATRVFKINQDLSSRVPLFREGSGEHDGPEPANSSALTHWPVQLRLVPPTAPFFQDADLLLVADCVPFAYADFHRRLLRGRPVVIGCPKLDDRQAALDKLTAILTHSSVRSLTVVHMEVPCCHALCRWPPPRWPPAASRSRWKR